jgi:CRP-like cAMP-binding protein
VEKVVFRTDDVITRAGHSGDAAYVVVSGDVVRIDGSGDQPVSEAVPCGALIGEMAMLIDHVYGADIIARGTVRTLRITRPALHAIMLQDPSLAEHFMVRIAERLRAVAQELRLIDAQFSDEEALGEDRTVQAPVGIFATRLEAFSGQDVH